MIQRIQSIWLLLAATAGILLYWLPLWSGRLQDGSVKTFNGTESLVFFAATAVTAGLGLVAVFLYKDRSTQKKMSILGLLLSLVLIALEFVYVNDYKSTLNFIESSWKPGALMPMLMAVFFFLAWQSIRKDEKLIKSLDRLR